eukprot:4705407-Prymnesium_polylepis.2
MNTTRPPKSGAVPRSPDAWSPEKLFDFSRSEMATYPTGHFRRMNWFQLNRSRMAHCSQLKCRARRHSRRPQRME